MTASPIPPPKYVIDASSLFYVGDSHSDVEAFGVAGTSVLFDPDDWIDATVENDVDVLFEERTLEHVASILRTVLDWGCLERR